MRIEYSSRLGHISEEQFQKALARFGLGNFVRAESVPFGNFGQNVFLTSDKGEFVFRGKPHYPWQFRSEKFVARLLHERTRAPVPWPYLVDEREDLFGWSYVIMPRMRGLQLKDRSVKARLTQRDEEEIAEALGESLFEMHKLTCEYPGEYDPKADSVKPLDRPFDKWIVERIDHFSALAASHNGRLSKEDRAWID